MKCDMCGTELKILFISAYCPKGCKGGVLGTQFQWQLLGTIKSMTECKSQIDCSTLGQAYSVIFEEVKGQFVYFRNSIISRAQPLLDVLVDYPESTGYKLYFSNHYDKYAIAPKNYTWQDGEYMIESQI